MMMQQCETEHFILFIRIAREIWLRRNGLIHAGSFTHPNAIIQKAKAAMEEYTQARQSVAVQREVGMEQIAESWKAPPTGWNKANWDVAIDRANGRVGIGVVVRDDVLHREAF
jgi:hypothetical protein